MFIFRILTVLATSLSWSSCKINNYCSICEDHTLCKYDNIGEDCVDVGTGGVSEEEKKEIVNTHNWLRNVIAGGFESRGANGPQPKAANLRKFVWDKELAKVAQAWSDQCRFEHDTCRNDKRWKVGQNIYWKMKYPTHHVNWTEAILSWYDEVAFYDSSDVQSYRFVPDTGHYTQMIWHDTYSIGCGRRDYGYNKIYVCNYGPTGNWIGEPMYLIGEPCSKCPQGTFCEQYLCAIVNSKKSEGAIKAADDVKEAPEPPQENAKDGYASENKTLDAAPEPKQNELHDKEVNAATTNSILEDMNEIDEETKKGLDKIVLEIKKLLKTVIKRLKAND